MQDTRLLAEAKGTEAGLCLAGIKDEVINMKLGFAALTAGKQHSLSPI